MQLEFMEHSLRLEAEAKYFVGATDRQYEQELMGEMLKIVEEAESLNLGSEYAARGTELFVNGFCSIRDAWKSA